MGKELVPHQESDLTTLNLNHGLSNPYIHQATSDNTRKAYRHDIKHFENWGGRLPAQPAMVAHYLEIHATLLNPRTLQRRMAALRQWHVCQGFQDPTEHPVIKKTLTGILRTHGKPKEKARPITPAELASIHLYLTAQNTPSALRDNALLQMGFFGAFRRSELVAIHYSHIRWDKAGLEILLPTSKTDQTHEGQYCAIPYGNSVLCPIHALKQWLTLSNITSGAIFRRISHMEHIGENALTPLSVNHILKKNARAIGIMDIHHISSHSLRRGLATSAALAGATLPTIMRAGRWKQTSTVIEYIEAAERFADNAASCVLQTLKQNEC